MTLTTIGSAVALVTSVLAAIGTFLKVLADRNQGIGDHELDQSKFGLDALQAAITVKDTLIKQYQEEIDRNRVQIQELLVRIDKLEDEIDELRNK